MKKKIRDDVEGVEDSGEQESQLTFRIRGLTKLFVCPLLGKRCTSLGKRWGGRSEQTSSQQHNTSINKQDCQVYVDIQLTFAAGTGALMVPRGHFTISNTPFSRAQS
jgi:hypothetical protein